MSIIKLVGESLSSTTNKVLLIVGTLVMAVIGNLITPNIQFGRKEFFVSTFWLLVMTILMYCYESEVRSLKRECKSMLSLEDATKAVSEAASMLNDVMTARPEQEGSNHRLVGDQMYSPVRDGAVYSGKWFGRHLSVSPNDKKTRVFSDHEYMLEANGTQITGQLIDHLVGNKYNVSGGFVKSGILWQLEDENDPDSYGLEIYISPLNDKEMKGFLFAFDYHSGKAFLTPIVLSRSGYPDIDKFASGIRVLLERVRVDEKVITTAQAVDSKERAKVP